MPDKHTLNKLCWVSSLNPTYKIRDRSCLIYGNNEKNEPIHSVWAYNEDTGYAILITVYRPSPEKWINWRTRRKTT